MPRLVTVDRAKLARRFEGVVQETRKKAARRNAAADDPGYNFVLKCGNMVQIFTPDRFHEIPYEVQRLVDWGNPLGEIELGVLESDDPFG